jgi:hypothetical protein
MLLRGDAKRNRDDLLDIALSLPFQGEVNTGFGILAKVRGRYPAWVFSSLSHWRFFLCYLSSWAIVSAAFFVYCTSFARYLALPICPPLHFLFFL